MTAYFPRATDQPRALPELRAALIEMARPESVWVRAEVQKLISSIADGMHRVVEPDGSTVMYSPEGLAPEEMQRRFDLAIEQAANTIRWYWERLPEAQLIHVSPMMTDFITAAAESVPAGMTLTPEDAPTPTGLVVFGRPVYGTDAGPDNPGQPVRVDGIMWGNVHLPPRDIPWYDPRWVEQNLKGVSVAMFRMIEPGQDDVLGIDVQRTIWVPLGRTDWPWGDRMDEKPSDFLPNASDEQWVSMQEDRRLLAALWGVINQKRLVESFDVMPDRGLRRRLARAGHGGRDEKVRIVHLRRTEYSMLDRTEETGRHVKVRFPVRPFYRRQPYGPGRSLRRIVLVPAHWRGPDDAPITHAERVWSVDR